MSWLKRLWHRKLLEDQLEKELRFHLDQHQADLVERGNDPDAAGRQARIALGGSEQIKESCRDARGTRWAEDLLRDCRYAIRALRQRPGFAAVAILTLGLGTGATTMMFTVIDSVLLKPLAFPHSDRLVSLHEKTGKEGLEWNLSYLNFLDCKKMSRSLTSMAAWRYAGGTISAPGDAEYVQGRQISADFFPVLGIPLTRGRAFSHDEDRPGGSPVAIISHHLWQTRYGGNDAAVGARILFEGQAYTIVGVAPASFRFSGEDADIFTPIGQFVSPTMQNREMHPGIRVLARLRTGVTLNQAQSELAIIGRDLAEQYPKSNAGHRIAAEPLRQDVVGDVGSTLWLLLASVGLVLLIACVNIASLLLARAVSRERELAMRTALGAGRGRLIRQSLTESSLLGVCGGAVGVLLAALGTHPFLLFWPGGLPRVEEIHLDWQVLLFALAASLLSGILFGLAPALRVPVRDLEQVLRAGSRTVVSSSRRLHSAFVISEIALAIVLLIAAGILGRTLLRITSLDPGIDPHNVLVTRVALSSDAIAKPARIRLAWRQILDRVRSTPGVRSTAIADVIPMGGDDEEIGYWTTPAQPAASQTPLALLNLVTPDYFQVMGIPLLRGRSFTDRDRTGSDLVVAIDEVMAKRVFPRQNPVGNRLSLQFVGPVRIVGIVGHVRHWGLDADDQATVREQVYLPFAQLPDPFVRLTASGMSLVVRTVSSPLNLVEGLRRSVRGTARDQAIYEIRTMEQVEKATLARERFLLLLFGLFAGLALLLACIGIYGVLAYLNSQRVAEFGIRLALGASARDVLRLVLGESIRMIFVGIVVGAAASVATGRLLERLVNGAHSTDLLTFTSMVLVLIVAALLASFLPARRASRIQPTTALRQE